MDHRPKCKAKTIKLLKENISINIHDLGLEDSFLDIISKAQAKINWTSLK